MPAGDGGELSERGAAAFREGERAGGGGGAATGRLQGRPGAGKGVRGAGLPRGGQRPHRAPLPALLPAPAPGEPGPAAGERCRARRRPEQVLREPGAGGLHRPRPAADLPAAEPPHLGGPDSLPRQLNLLPGPGPPPAWGQVQCSAVQCGAVVCRESPTPGAEVLDGPSLPAEGSAARCSAARPPEPESSAAQYAGAACRPLELEGAARPCRSAGCTFYGNPATQRYCSGCYRELQRVPQASRV
jgi:hypothetical protein